MAKKLPITENDLKVAADALFEKQGQDSIVGRLLMNAVVGIRYLRRTHLGDWLALTTHTKDPLKAKMFIQKTPYPMLVLMCPNDKLE